MSAAFEHFSPIKSKNVLNQVKNVFENKNFFFGFGKIFKKFKELKNPLKNAYKRKNIKKKKTLQILIYSMPEICSVAVTIKKNEAR